MSEGSLVARRMVFDGVMNEGGISDVDVNRKMLKFGSNAHSEYMYCILFVYFSKIMLSHIKRVSAKYPFD